MAALLVPIIAIAILELLAIWRPPRKKAVSETRKKAGGRTSVTRRVVLVVLLSLAAIGAAVGVSFAAFGGPTANAGNSFAATNDFVAPNASASVIVRQNGGVAGYVKQGGSYYVYATVSDTGNPASGTASVVADASSITTGAKSAALASGSHSAAGRPTTGAPRS